MPGAHGRAALLSPIYCIDIKKEYTKMKKNTIMKTVLSLALACFLTIGSAAAVYADTTSQMPTSSQTTQISETTAESSAVLTAKATTKTTEATKKALTSKQVLKKLKKSLGKSYTSDTKETKQRLEDYYGLNMKKVVNWAAETNSNSSLQSDTTIILKVKKGYAKTAAKKLQKGYEQVVSYNRMYNMDLQRVLQARLYVNGNYVALIIEGKQADYNLSAEDQAKYAKKEAKKIDKAWKKIFGSAKNKIKIPKDDTKKNYFDMTEEIEAGK